MKYCQEKCYQKRAPNCSKTRLRFYAGLLKVCSHDLNVLDFLLWSYAKENAHKTSSSFHDNPDCMYRLDSTCTLVSSHVVSSVARGGGAGSSRCKIARFWCFWGRFLVKNRKQPPPPPKEIGCRSCEVHIVIRPEKAFKFPISAKKSVSISVKIFFFGDHLFLGWKNVWISELSEKFRLHFRTNRVILIQE